MQVLTAESYDDLCHRAASRFVEAANSVVRPSIALSGGSTPKALYTLLAQEPYRSQIPWEHVQLFWGDERSVPPDHPDSNYKMAMDAMLSKVPVPEGNIHRMVAEADDRDASARDYEALIRRLVPDGRFTLIQLGMGDDGHTASLFPHTAALKITDRWVVPNRVDKLDTWRMTFTYPLINAAHSVEFLVSGAKKAEVLARVLDGPRDPGMYPSQGVRPPDGQLTWLVDREAAMLVKVTGS